MTYDEATEIAIPPAALANWAEYEYRIAETEMLQLCAPVTRPDGLILPFPSPWPDYELQPRARHLAPRRVRITGRGVAVLATVAGVLGSIGAGWLW